MKIKTLTTDEILKVVQAFLENGDTESFQSNFPLKAGDVIVRYSNEDGYEEIGICLVNGVYPDVEFLDPVFFSSENYYADNSDGDWEEIINQQYLTGDLEGGEKYFSEHEGIWEKFQEAKDKREFIRNLMKKEA